MHSRQYFLNNINHLLFRVSSPMTARHHYVQLEFRYNNDILATISPCKKRRYSFFFPTEVTRPPEISIAQGWCWFNVGRGRFLYPGCRHKLLSVPLSVVQV